MATAQRIIITGGNGFVGRHLLQELLTARAPEHLLVWDRTIPDDLPVSGIKMDITEPTTYLASLKEFAPTWIVHLAAQASIPASLARPEETHRINVEATQQFLTTARAVNPSVKFLIASTADIYGKRSAATPLPELSLDQAQPPNPYARSKWEMEKIIEAEYRDCTIRVRPFPHIGPGQQRGFVAADFASQIAAIEAGVQPPQLSVGNLDAQRDFTDVRDVVRAYRLLIEKGTVGEVYHVASGKAISIHTLMTMLLEAANVPITVQQDPTRLRPSDTPAMVGDASKLRAATGWQPEIPLKQTVRDILDWWRMQEIK